MNALEYEVHVVLLRRDLRVDDHECFHRVLEASRTSAAVRLVPLYVFDPELLRHGLRQVTQSAGLAAAVNLLLGNMEGLVVAGAEVFKLATLNSYSREQETAADAEGVRMLHASAIDPMSLARFFETMQREAGDLPAALTWLSTHPDHAARMAAVRSQVATLPATQYRIFAIDWGEVQDHAGGR